MAEQEITLAVGESKVVSFEATPHEAKTYQVSVNGLTGTFVAKAVPLVVGDPKSFAVLNIEGIPFSSVAEDYILTRESLATVLSMGFVKYYRQTSAYAPDYKGWKSEDAAKASAVWVADNWINWETRQNNYPATGDRPQYPAERSFALVFQALIAAHPEHFISSPPKIDIFNVYFFTVAVDINVIKATLNPSAKAPNIILSSPITMSVMRGVTLHCVTAIMQPPAAGITGQYAATLHYLPTFVAEMSPPGFRGFHPWITSSNPNDWGKPREFNFPVTGCFAGGYYYPGIYNGRFQLWTEFTTPYGGGGGYGLLNFVVKNLAQVTGKGTVTAG